MRTPLFIVTICMLSCNSSTQTDLNHNLKETPILRDTIYSKKTLDDLKFQVLDYIGITKKSQIDKFVKYTPKFLYECSNIDGENFSDKYDMMSFLNVIFKNSMDQKNIHDQSIPPSNRVLPILYPKASLHIKTTCKTATK